MLETITTKATDFISFSNALSGFLGASVTLFLTYRWRIHDRRVRKEALKRIFLAELQTVRDTYALPQASQNDESAAKNILSVSLMQNYTTIYDENAKDIGLLGAQASASIVTAYTLLKSLIDATNQYVALNEKTKYKTQYNENDKFYYAQIADSLYHNLLETKERTFAAIEEAIRLLS